MESCIFSYYVSESDIAIDELKQKRNFGKYIVLTDSRTPILHAKSEDCECLIFGYAVNVFTGESVKLADQILRQCSNIDDVVEFEKSMGGKYIIFYRDGEQYYVQCDATSSIPVFYQTEKAFACTSNMHYVVEHYGYQPDPILLHIRESGEISQAMPFDITQYREIKQLLPNHYLSINEKKAVRFVNCAHKQKRLTVEKATELVAPLIQTLCDFYQQTFAIRCPITSGRDSRVVLAFLADRKDDVHCYTIKHPEHHEDSQDIVISKLLCAENHILYEQIQDVTVSQNIKGKMDRLLGQNHYSPRTLRIAQTINEHYGREAIINGDIIGQVGKCSLHRDIPQCFATPSYFRCKLHNYSYEAKSQLESWMKEIRNDSECVNAFDLFSIENRMGRWAAQENLIYNSIGQIYLNIFNSRSIIYLWTAVSRNERKKSSIHIGLIKNKMPELMDIPFEEDKSILVRLSKANGLTYLLSSYAKYYIERKKFKKERRNEKVDNNSR